MRIGEVARAANVRVDTVRFYERKGILVAPPRRASGYRDYAATAPDRVVFAKSLQSLGLTLAEIAALLADVDGGSASCGNQRVRFERALARVDEKIASLVSARQALARGLAVCSAGACGLVSLPSTLASRPGPPPAGSTQRKRVRHASVAPDAPRSRPRRGALAPGRDSRRRPALGSLSFFSFYEPTMHEPPAKSPDPPASLEMIRAMLDGRIEPPPIAKLIGFVVVEIDVGTAVFELVGDPAKHANPMGTMHGGVLVDLGDAAMGFAMFSTLAAGESFTTIELKANFFKPVWRQKLRAVATMVKRSSTLGYLECDITDEKGALVCRLGSTCMVLRGDAAKGR